MINPKLAKKLDLIGVFGAAVMVLGTYWSQDWALGMGGWAVAMMLFHKQYMGW